MDCIAPFQFDEIDVGRFLGKGEFSNVYEVDLFHPRPSSEEKNGDGMSSQQEYARDFLTTHVKHEETRDSQYAIKFLRENISDDPVKFVTAAHDLAREAQFLSSLKHPNIIKLRGCSADKINVPFLILDCLCKTLARQLDKWKKENSNLQVPILGSFLGKNMTKNCSARERLLGDRLRAACDISGAIAYLHEQNVIYRDLKPTNMGFDSKGNIKLFDFGLAKELPSNVDMNEEVYKMSGAGSLRYMAPEIVLDKPYNLKADVFSFSILLYQIVALEKPYAGFSQDRIMQDVIIGNGRPKLKSGWPEAIRDIIEMSWSKDISKRPTMDALRDLLQFHVLTMMHGYDTGLERTYSRRQSFGSGRSSLPGSYCLPKKTTRRNTIY